MNNNKNIGNMSLYIHSENQQIVWKILQNVPALHTFQCPDKLEWFRSIMMKFYEANQFKSLTPVELQQMNRDTIAYMIRELNKPIADVPTKKTEDIHSFSFTNTFLPSTTRFAPDSSIQENSFTNNMIPKMGVDPKTVTRNYLSQQKQTAVNEKFAERQYEYETMIKGNAPKPIDFRQIMSEEQDGTLENINDLVQKYRQERDLLSEPSPPPPPPALRAKVLAQVDKPIIRTDANILDITNLDSMEISHHKNVRWSETLEESHIIHETEPLFEIIQDIPVIDPFSNQVEVLRQELKQFMDEMKKIVGMKPTAMPLSSITTADSKTNISIFREESIEC